VLILLSGQDATGKGTQTRLIQPLLRDKPIQIIHNIAIKGFKEPEECRKYMLQSYTNMFKMIQENSQDNHFILDRSHISEYVYSMYRNYDGFYVFDELESMFNTLPFWQEAYLITLTDTPENLLAREDGNSPSINVQDKIKEMERFIEATKLSSIPHKIHIHNKDIDSVFNTIKQFLFE
jgi:thymidylate kinase